MKDRVRAIGLALAVTASIFVGVPSAHAAGCNETTKFVQNVSGTNLYYGNRDAVGSYDHLPYCSGGVMRASTFLRLRDDYLSWVEDGVSQDYGDPSGVAHIWTEWGVYPAPAVAQYWGGNAAAGSNVWYAFEINNSGGGQFDLWWALSNNPDTASWQFITTSPAFGRNVGEVESEAARIGSGDALHTAQVMEKKNTGSSGWSAWDNLQCDTSQNSMHGGYNAVKLSNQHWQNKISTTGLCA